MSKQLHIAVFMVLIPLKQFSPSATACQVSRPQTIPAVQKPRSSSAKASSWTLLVAMRFLEAVLSAPSRLENLEAVLAQGREQGISA